ncbi:MAG: amidohydrolase [Porticoccaceae bacterium]|nr:amidohydrolase [Porticoccaceae bacterium]
MLDYLIRGAVIVDGLGNIPYKADIGLANGRIVDVGDGLRMSARETLDVDGCIAAPGWVDIHTHYDGQATWDTTLDPSASHGVTTVVMGNCGVGFAPVRQGDHPRLIELMEGVEDIPGTALYEGIPWDRWQSFPQYLDYLADRHYSMDIGAMIAHGPVRAYAMGERGCNNGEPTPNDLKAMAEIVSEAMLAGALGFSTSRTLFHQSMSGQPVPGTFADEAELGSVVDAMARAGGGVFASVPGEAVAGLMVDDSIPTLEDEIAMMARLSRRSGLPVTWSFTQDHTRPERWRDLLTLVRAKNGRGARLFPQVASKPTSSLISLKTYHPFMRRETYLRLRNLPFDRLLAELKKPEVKAAILADEDVPDNSPGSMENFFLFAPMDWSMTFDARELDTEPHRQSAFDRLAAVVNQTPEAYLYDFLVAGQGDNFAARVFVNFANYSYEAMREMFQHPDTVIGTHDAGAHVNLICDGVVPTYHLTHWVRDREAERGPTLDLVDVVAKQTRNNACLFGLGDRGVIQAGKRADLNIIDLDNLSLGPLQLVRDLPAGGQRLLRGAHGYVATFVNGHMTRRDDQDTGARPGRLIRRGAL